MTCSNQQTRFWLALGPALCLPLLGSIIYFGTNAPPVIAKSFYGGTKAFLVIWPIVAWLWILPKTDRPLAQPKRKLASAIGGVAIGLIIAAAMFGLMLTPIGDHVRATVDLIREKGAQLGFLEHFLIFAISVSLVHSFIEEFFWRGFVYPRLATVMRPIWAHLISAAGFASYHYIIVWIYFPESHALALFLGTAVGIGGFLWSQLYQRTGTLIGPWISHLIIDLAVYWIAWQVLSGT